MTDVTFPGDDNEDEAWQHVFSDSDVQQQIMRREMLLEPRILCEKLPFKPSEEEIKAMSVDNQGKLNPQASVVEFKSEIQLANELKARAETAMDVLCQIMDECAKHGFRLAWQGIGVNAWGKNQVVDLHLEKRF